MEQGRQKFRTRFLRSRSRRFEPSPDTRQHSDGTMSSSSWCLVALSLHCTSIMVTPAVAPYIKARCCALWLAGGVRSLMTTLKQHANLVKAVNDPNTYIVNESPDPLRRSLHSMDLDDLVLGGLGTENGMFDQRLFSGTISKLKRMAMDTTSMIFHNKDDISETTLEEEGCGNRTFSAGSSTVSIPVMGQNEDPSPVPCLSKREHVFCPCRGGIGGGGFVVD